MKFSIDKIKKNAIIFLLMTKDEILYKSNSCKIEYNSTHKDVEMNRQYLKTLNKYKKFFDSKKKRAKTLKNYFLFSALILTPITISIMFITPLSAILFIIINSICWERFNFFNYANNRFSSCFNMFDKLSEKVNIKQHNYILKENQIMEQIIALEKEIPDDIKNEISLLDLEKIEEENEIGITF